jgi:hypothetical protein
MAEQCYLLDKYHVPSKRLTNFGKFPKWTTGLLGSFYGSNILYLSDQLKPGLTPIAWATTHATLSQRFISSSTAVISSHKVQLRYNYCMSSYGHV